MVAVDAGLDARRALLGRLIDHAPTFPPASLPPADAIEEHRRARASDAAWIVNRLVVPVSLLAEFNGVDVPLSVVVDSSAAAEDERIEAFELPPGGSRHLFRMVEVYCELALSDSDLGEALAMLRKAGWRAKVRCGGASVPSVGALADFVRACRDAAVPFKATAGLHHAVAADGRHGFLNLLAAAVFGDEEEALGERDAAAFHVDAESFSWRDRRADAGDLARVRRNLFVSFGSCSFSEPVEELAELGLLPA